MTNEALNEAAHEAYLKLVDQQNVRWQNRAHFFGIAAQAMRRILVDHARARLAEKRGWKIGERIPLKGTYYQFDLDLVLCGTFDSPKNTDSLWFHWKYLDEGLKQAGAPGAGNAGTIFAKVESAEMIPQVAKDIDDHFASSENPTRTQSEAAFAQMFIDMLGNIQTYILIIGAAVVFSLSLVAANAMAMCATLGPSGRPHPSPSGPG